MLQAQHVQKSGGVLGCSTIPQVQEQALAKWETFVQNIKSAYPEASKNLEYLAVPLVGALNQLDQHIRECCKHDR
jgi:hypothetical protein